MKIKSFYSSSSGSLYKISNDDISILIEAGVSITKIKKSLNFKLREVAGVLISHSHL